ncbi:MAG: response regulator, partial [Phenylobacterium sp.]
CIRCDNPDDRDMMQRRFEKLGYSVATAADGAHALSMIAREAFDLVLLDVNMPGIDGLEVLKRLRVTHPASELPVIMVTATLAMAVQVKALGLGANDYLTKPVIIEVAQARVEKQLAGKRAEVDSQAAYEDLARTLTTLQTAVAEAQRKADLLAELVPEVRAIDAGPTVALRR